jgi:hypothetical protein
MTQLYIVIENLKEQWIKKVKEMYRSKKDKMYDKYVLLYGVIMFFILHQTINNITIKVKCDIVHVSLI